MGTRGQASVKKCPRYKSFADYNQTTEHLLYECKSKKVCDARIKYLKRDEIQPEERPYITVSRTKETLRIIKEAEIFNPELNEKLCRFLEAEEAEELEKQVDLASADARRAIEMRGQKLILEDDEKWFEHQLEREKRLMEAEDEDVEEYHRGQEMNDAIAELSRDNKLDETELMKRLKNRRPRQ